jgi:hypothetical protein
MDISSLVNATPPEPSAANATPTPQSALFSAINSATLERVQTVLREICAQNPQAFELASAKLLVPNRDDAKRKRDTTHQQRYEICVQCEEEYDVLDNEQGACEWHPGTPKFLTYTFIVHIVLLFHFFIDLISTSRVPDNVYVTQARRNQISTATSGPITMKTVTGRLTRKICARCIRRDIAGVVATNLVRRRGASWGCMCLIWGRGGRVVREF